jgi:hypothetical protein
MRAPDHDHILNQGTARHGRQQLSGGLPLPQQPSRYDHRCDGTKPCILLLKCNVKLWSVFMMVNENDIFLSRELELWKLAGTLESLLHDHARDTAYSVHS